jgi:hypothetical protein
MFSGNANYFALYDLNTGKSDRRDTNGYVNG